MSFVLSNSILYPIDSDYMSCGPGVRYKYCPVSGKVTAE